MKRTTTLLVVAALASTAMRAAPITSSINPNTTDAPTAVATLLANDIAINAETSANTADLASVAALETQLSANLILATEIDTLAELNALVADATLIDTSDSRLSDARTPTAHTHAASEVTSGAFADARISESSVTQHEAALTITESQISDLGSYQPLDADLTTYAGITPSANAQSLLGSADYAAMRGLLDLEAGTDFLAYPSGTANGSKFLRDDNTWQAIPGGGDALTASPLSQFAATTSAQLAGVLSDETGSGAAVFAGSPTLTTPNLGTPSSITLTNGTGLPGTGVSITDTGDYYSGSDAEAILQEIGASLASLGSGFDATAVDDVTWSDGASATVTHTYAVTGADPTIAFSDGTITLGADLALGSNDISGVGTITATTTAATSLSIGGTTITATGAELNVLDGIPGTLTATELGYVDGVTSAIQTQLNGKVAEATFPISIGVAASDETTDLTTGAAKITFRAPYAFTLTAVRANVNTAPVGSTLNVDINEGGVSVLSTALSIDASEETSTTAATAAVISDSSIADDAEITIDIDQIGSSTAGKGLKVWLIGTRSL